MKTTFVALYALMLLMPFFANANNAVDSNTDKLAGKPFLRSDSKPGYGKKPVNQLKRNAGQPRQQQGRVLIDSDINEARQERNNNRLDLEEATITPVRQESLNNKRDQNRNSLKNNSAKSF